MTSLMLMTVSPAPCNDLIAASLPDPGPFMNTSIWRKPMSIPRLAACSAALCAANAVPFRDPLNPEVPALAVAITLPSVSVILTRVLLNVEYMYARPCGTLRRSRLRVRGLGIIYYLPPERRPRPATVRLGPFRERAFVLVRWPCTGNPRLCRRPLYEPISIRRRMFWFTSLLRSPSVI